MTPVGALLLLLGLYAGWILWVAAGFWALLKVDPTGKLLDWAIGKEGVPWRAEALVLTFWPWVAYCFRSGRSLKGQKQDVGMPLDP